MDRNFLAYYEDELAHVRELATEFAALHPTVARNLSLDAVPCPDPYVERLLEGVAYLAARTRLKVDAESSRYVRNLLDELYPDLVCPAPAMTMVTLLFFMTSSGVGVLVKFSRATSPKPLRAMSRSCHKRVTMLSEDRLSEDRLKVTGEGVSILVRSEKA